MEPLLTGVLVPVNLISFAPSDPEFAGGPSIVQQYNEQT